MRNNMQSGKPDDEKELAAAGKQFVAATQEVMSDIFGTGRPFSETVSMIHQLVDEIDELMSKELAKQGLGEGPMDRSRAHMLIGTLASLMSTLDDNLSMPQGLTDVLGEVVEKLKAKGVKIEVKYIKPSSNESLPSDQN